MVSSFALEILKEQKPGRVKGQGGDVGWVMVVVGAGWRCGWNFIPKKKPYTF